MAVEHATAGVLIFMLLLVLPVFYFIRRAFKESDLYVRRIAGIGAIDEAVGRAAEMGRPISFSTGITPVSPTLYAVLGVLYYVARKAALFKNRLILPQNDPQVMAIAEDVMRDGYRAEGRLSAFDPKNIIFLSEEQFAFAAGYMGLIHREQVATAFLFGFFAAESLILAEAGQQVGAMQVAASESPEQVAFFICTCDYTLIGEELYAAAAYLTREPVQLGSLLGQDRAKLVFFIMIIVGVTIATINSFTGWQMHNLGWYIRYPLW
ncbi:MAG: hypothetical protein D6719_10720 [Candidatus Dadabacteria bacterium]|nr:MAG: hypothetical protein D6719_10720 [Candidatus Dadabacteria bacterium]